MFRHRQLCLLRNWSQTRRRRLGLPWRRPRALHSGGTNAAASQEHQFRLQLNALNSTRSVRTRQLSNAESNATLTRRAELGQVLRLLLDGLLERRDESTGKELCAPLQHLPNARKYPEYYQVIETPICFQSINQRLLSGGYATFLEFDTDVLRLMRNAEVYAGFGSWLGKLVATLRGVYHAAKVQAIGVLEALCGESLSEEERSALLESEARLLEKERRSVREVEVVRCVCGNKLEEGLMVQCEQCFVWQHADCLEEEQRHAQEQESYLCEVCSARPVSRDRPERGVPVDALPESCYYVALVDLKSSEQYRLGDCVYVAKDGDATRKDIICIDRLWHPKDDSTARMLYGYYYLRPEETFHEPNRRFFEKEVFRWSVGEEFALHEVLGRCAVLDILSYAKGRPRGFAEEDVYVADYRVDKYRRSFSKLSKTARPVVNTAVFCFQSFPSRCNMRRCWQSHLDETTGTVQLKLVSCLHQDTSGRSSSADAAYNLSADQNTLNKSEALEKVIARVYECLPEDATEQREVALNVSPSGRRRSRKNSQRVTRGAPQSSRFHDPLDMLPAVTLLDDSVKGDEDNEKVKLLEKESRVSIIKALCNNVGKSNKSKRQKLKNVHGRKFLLKCHKLGFQPMSNNRRK